MILVFLLPLSGQEATGEGWKLAKNKNDIEVYTRAPEGSKFKEYKAITTISASPEELLAVLLDVDGYTQWMTNVKETYLLEKVSEEEFYVYTEVKVPWPFDNRDDITKSIVTEDTVNGGYIIHITFEPDYLPEKKGLVRMRIGHGEWVFNPVGNGKSRVEHRFVADPAGHMPAWVVNMFIVDGPHKTMLGLKSVLGD